MPTYSKVCNEMYDWKLGYKPDEKKLDLVFTGRQFRGLLDSLKLIIASFLSESDCNPAVLPCICQSDPSETELC